MRYPPLDVVIKRVLACPQCYFQWANKDIMDNNNATITVLWRQSKYVMLARRWCWCCYCLVSFSCKLQPGLPFYQAMLLLVLSHVSSLPFVVYWPNGVRHGRGDSHALTRSCSRACAVTFQSSVHHKNFFFLKSDKLNIACSSYIEE